MFYNPLPSVAIIGRTNVGKSTLFNCLIENKKALVSNIPETTRDRNYGTCLWRGKTFNVIDTGGIVKLKLSEKYGKATIEEKIIEQVKIALKEADLILFLVDAQTPIFPQDKEIALLLRKEKKPIFLVITKTDNLNIRKNIDPGIFRFGFKNPFLISAVNGSGIGDLLDEIIKQLKAPSIPSFSDKKIVKVSIIGRPNVGKSSLLNSILGEEKVIVSETPHTTRAPQDTPILFQNQPILLIDTAGIRKKARIDNALEKGGVKLSLKSLKESDIILMVLEAQEPIGKQDKKLISLALEYKKSIILIANKWDLVSSNQPDKECRDYILSFFPYLKFAPLLFTSAKTNFNVEKILPLILKIKEERGKIIEQKILDEIMKTIDFPCPKKGKFPKIYNLSQKDTNPPYFALSVSKKEWLPQAFLNIIEKKLREKFTFSGTPINIGVRSIKN